MATIDAGTFPKPTSDAERAARAKQYESDAEKENRRMLAYALDDVDNAANDCIAFQHSDALSALASAARSVDTDISEWDGAVKSLSDARAAKSLSDGVALCAAKAQALRAVLQNASAIIAEHERQYRDAVRDAQRDARKRRASMLDIATQRERAA